MTSLPFKILTVLFVISRRPLLPSNSKLEGLVKPVCDRLKTETALIWLQIKSGKPFEMKSCQMLQKGEHHSSRGQTVSSRRGFLADISTYITSRDSTFSCTWTEHPLLLRNYEKLGSTALKLNYRQNRVVTEIKESAGSTVKAVVNQGFYPRTLRDGFLDIWRNGGRYSCSATSEIYFFSRLKYSNNAECLHHT